MGFVVRGYGRASTDGQVLSTEKQEAVCLDIFEFKKRTNPEWSDAVWGGFIADEATCRETKFRERHAGSLILAATQPRDRILGASHDRLFGSLIDFCEMMKLCETMKFVVVVGDKEIDYADEANVCYYKILTAFAELEINRLRRRTREALAYRMQIGRPSTKPPCGWKIVQVMVPGIPAPQKYLVPDNPQRRLAREINNVRLNNGFGYHAAIAYCNEHGILRIRRKWTIRTFWKWCKAANLDFPLHNGSYIPAPIPPNAQPVRVQTISADDDWTS